MGRKGNKAEWDLASEQAKRLKIEQKLKVVVRDSENRKGQCKEKFKRLAKKSRKKCKNRDKEVQTKRNVSLITPNSTRQG